MRASEPKRPADGFAPTAVAAPASEEPGERVGRRRPFRVGRPATFLDWCMLLGIVALCLAILSRWIWQDWSSNGIWGWYQAYLDWQKRNGILWLPF